MNLKQGTNAQQAYTGRFAPSPSGLLHFGSLLSALASYLDAKANNGRWLVRIDNIDPPREQTNAASNILNSLELFGFQWDDSVIYQSNRFPSYIDTCITLIENNLVYPCSCSRKALAKHEQYPGLCRKHLEKNEKIHLISSLKKSVSKVHQKNKISTLHPILIEHSLRIRTDNFDLQKLNFEDCIQGHQQVPKSFGDFIILRKDSLPSYMLACGLDDLQDQITHIVRGSDLLEPSFWQRFLQIQYLDLQKKHQSLKLNYSHLPLILNDLHQKLSKQHHAPEIDSSKKGELLFLALSALGQSPDSKLKYEEAPIILEWAVKHWQANQIPIKDISFNSLTLS